jgi:mannosyltransferase OCH1-like enzyme
MIPKIINKIYLSHNNDFQEIIEPLSLREAHLTWKTLNPDYDLRYFNVTQCQEYLLNNFDVEHCNTFKNLIPFSYKCDFFRYCVVYKEGGWYSDWKQEILIPLDNILNEEEKSRIKFIFAYDNGSEYTRYYRCLATSFFGSVPNNPVLKSAIDKIIDNVKKKNYGMTPLDPTGPYVFGEALLENKDKFDNSSLKIGTFDYNNYFEFDKRLIVKHKCDGVRHDQFWECGNNYAELWGSRSIYI